MKKKIFGFACLCLLFMVNCKNEKNTTKVKETQQEVNTTTPTKQVIPSLRLPITAEFAAQADRQALPGYMKDVYWEYKHAETVTESHKTNIYAGHWVLLKDKGHYEKGVYAETKSKGRFVYDDKQKTIELRPETAEVDAEVFDIKTNMADVMIWTRSKKYQQNSEMIKVAASPQRPSQ